MKLDTTGLYASNPFKVIYGDALRAMRDHGMAELVRGGALVGFSGGADSVMLLLVLQKYTSENGLRLPVAVHVNHMIRGAEADFDESFSRDFCTALGVEFLSYSRDIPAESKLVKMGLEETARNTRYSIFNDLMRSRNDIACAAVAHNATDNLETMIFNMMRGTGLRGMAGIAPHRDSVIRPLIYTPKRDIIAALDAFEIPYVTDSTNSDLDYKRNYIRHEIIPRLSVLADDPEASATGLSARLREDNAFIETLAARLFSSDQDALSSSDLAKAEFPVFARAVSMLASRFGASLEEVHLRKIRELILKGSFDFSVDIPGGMRFSSVGGKATVSRKSDSVFQGYEYRLELCENYIPEVDKYVILSRLPISEFSSNVYKISIQQKIDSDIIKGELLVREKRDGDSYVYGKMTRKLKKLFNDRSISIEARDKIPVICDSMGILWVPGFGVRDGGEKNPQNVIYFAIAERA